MFKPIRSFFKRYTVAATFVHRIGSAGPTIAKLAERQKFDLVVLGTHGQGAVADS